MANQKKSSKLSTPKGPKAKAKVKKVLNEWKSGKLHSGSKHGPKVTSQKQAIAIALDESRRLGKGKGRKKASKTSKK